MAEESGPNKALYSELDLCCKEVPALESGVNQGYCDAVLSSMLDGKDFVDQYIFIKRSLIKNNNLKLLQIKSRNHWLSPLVLRQISFSE